LWETVLPAYLPGEQMSNNWSKGSTRQWRKTRAAVLLANQQENRGQCTLQIKGVCTGTADQVHHIQGKAFGDRISNLAAVCRACNLKIGDPTRISPAPRPRSNWGI
jgi:5-methylcytosine-specific restriction endonuclease McrA